MSDERRVVPESFKRETVDRVANSGLTRRRWPEICVCTRRCCVDG